MSTYEEIRNHLLNKGFNGKRLSMADVEEMAAKEYAKQWIERAAEKATRQFVEGGVKWIDATSIRNVKKEIDANG